MLQNKITPFDLQEEKLNARELLTTELRKYYEEESEIVTIDYPVLNYPSKITSLSFDKTPDITGILNGIKGQYLIFENGSVLNIRKHNGYFIRLSY